MNNIAISVHGSPNINQRSHYKYYIDVSDRWNDYGYRTLCRLYRIMDNANDIFIGYLRCFNFNGEIGTEFYHPSTSSRCFITDLKTAYKLLMYVPKEERIQLISELHICLIFKSEISEPIFTKSIMRDKDSETFIKLNNEIKKIIQTEIDVNELVISERNTIEKLFNQINVPNCLKVN